MLGFGKTRLAIADAETYCRAMVSGFDRLHKKPVPNQMFADPYVMGFLQQIVMHAATVAHHGKPPKPKIMSNIMTSAMDRIVPGFGKHLVVGLQDVVNPEHSMHLNYQVGRREGVTYVIALNQGDEEKQLEMMQSFRDFVVRNYLT